MKLIIFCLLILLTGCLSKTGEGLQKSIEASALKNDLEVLQKTLEEAHPGLYWYLTKSAIDSLFDTTKAAIKHDITRMEFFKILLPVIAAIRCSHTNLRIPDDRRRIDTFPFTNLLPIEPVILNEKVYARRWLTDSSHEGGEEVFSINGVPIGEIMSRLLNGIPADGYNRTFKYNALSRGVFTEGYALYFGDTAVFTIGVKDSSGAARTIRVKAATPEQVRSIIKGPLPVFTVNYEKDVAVVAINSFAINTRQFEDSVTAIFRSLKVKQTSKLIIDLRQNGGGTNDNVSLLFSFIARSPFLHLKRAEVMGRPLSYSSFISNAGSIERYSKEHEENGRYIVSNSYIGTRMRDPQGTLNFNGDVILLVSGNTTSAASEFAAIFHYLQRGKVVGEETGGGYYGSTGGNFLNLRLPHSGLEVKVPTVRIFNAVDEEFIRQPIGRGTFPDHPVTPSFSDIKRGKDVQMEKALEILIHDR